VQEFQKKIKYMKAIMDQDRQVLDMLDRQRREVGDELAVLKENMAKIEVLKETKDRKMAQLKKSIEKKIFLLMKVHREKEFYEKAVKELREAARALNQAMRHLETEEREGIYQKGLLR
jgi:peptidoglycan hydrolase CwlO-like protein